MYIDIHTHFPKIDKDILFIQNIIAGIDTIPKHTYFSIGIHPWYTNKSNLDIIRQNISKPNCLAIGECGLDFTPKQLKNNSLKQQINLFQQQIELSEQHRKPVILHCVKCFDKILQIKKELKPKQPWIIHGYQKNEILAQQLTNAGLFLSFGTSIFSSIPNQKALRNLPLNKIFFESDAQQNYDIKAIYLQAAQLLKIPLIQLQQQIEMNFNTVF